MKKNNLSLTWTTCALIGPSVVQIRQHNGKYIYFFNCASSTSLASSPPKNQVQLSIPRTKTTLGMRSFAVTGPVIWNSLPAALRTATLSPLTLARQSTSQGSPVWLIDSASEDHLWRAIQIHSSSSSSSSASKRNLFHYHSLWVISANYTIC